VCEHTINGSLLCRMLHSGFDSLSHNKSYLDELNLFPVSDSDTGTNMKNTFEKGVAALEGEGSFHDVISVFAKGMLIGSRGNSGFILSQYFWGIYEYTKDKETVTVADLCGALQHAYCLAHDAVLHPAEGTMLTVMRDGIHQTLPGICDEMSVKAFFDVLVEKMFLCTQETVMQMDVLRENNVVDSGALGIYLIFDGMKRALHDDVQYFDCEQSNLLPKRIPDFIKNVSFFRYCTEFILKMHDVKEKDYFACLLEKRGNSIVVAVDGDVLKVHIHTNKPQQIMEEFTNYGSIVTKKIDDLFMTQEFERLQQRKHNGFAVVAFADDEGNATILEHMGVDVAFRVPTGYSPDDDELKMLMDGFLAENLIAFPTDKKIHERLKSAKWYSNLQKLHVVESEGLAKTFFTLSSLVFADEFENIIKSLDILKKKRVFQASIQAAPEENRTQYTSCLDNKIIADEDLATLLHVVAGEEMLTSYSTVVVFGGKKCTPADIDCIHAHFEKNGNVEFTYLDNKHHDGNFIIGAY